MPIRSFSAPCQGRPLRLDLKNGITYNGCGCADTVDGVATGVVSSSTITGAGAVPVIAQNGVQVGFGAGPVTVTDNDISGNRYTGDPNNGTGAGVLIFSSKNNVITLNDVSANNNGVVFQGGSFGLCVAGDSTGNSATCNRITDHDAFTYEVGVSSDAAANTVEDNAITGNTVGVDGSAITSGNLDAENNWWGCPTGPNTAGCDTTAGAVDATPFRSTIPPCVACTTNADCNDGLACNGTETCAAGTCAAGTPIDCSGASDQCNVGTCTEPLGTCVAVPKVNGTPCNSGDVCTLPDSCQGGVCVAGGGGDSDADTICDADDNCPTDANPGQEDSDGDDVGNVCDANDGALNITQLDLKRQSNPVNVNGSVGIKGEVITVPADNFLATPKVTLAVTDSLLPTPYSITQTWTVATECVIKGTRLTCATADRKFKVRFKPLPKTPSVYRFVAKFRKLAIPSNQVFTGPVTTVLTFGPPPPAAGQIDRVGVISDCRASASGLKCREF